MAPTISKMIHDETNQPMYTQPMRMSDDDATETAGSNRSQNDAEEQEIRVKWQLPGTNTDLPTAKKQLVKALLVLLTAFPKQIVLVDRKQQEWMYQETEDESRFAKEFDKAALQLHASKNKDQKVLRWIAITTIRTTTTISEWKDHDQFHLTLSEMKIYAFPHPFAHDDWDIASIGFLKGVHAVHYPKDELHEQILQTIISDNPGTVPPQFQLIPQRITTADKKSSTKAFIVQCPRSKTEQMTHLLTHGTFRNIQRSMFVPFKYKNTKPDVYLQCIRQQNEVYYKTWIIKVTGISSDALGYMSPDIMTLKGVQHIVSTRHTKETGERKILVDQSKCAYIHRQLTAMWNNLLSKVPQTVLEESPSTYATPKISSKKTREYQDTDSDADSYGSLLTVGTEGTKDTPEENEFDALPTSYRYQSYADSVMASIPTESSTQFSSPTTSTTTEWKQEKVELEAKLQQQAEQLRKQNEQIEKIQADLESRIARSKDLEDQLAQAIELAHSRDERHEEMMEKFEKLMRRHEQELETNESVQNADVVTRTNGSSESPPLKRVNTNASPNRVYAVFRQTTGGQQLRRTNLMSKYPIPRPANISGTEPQNMETDEEVSSPLPADNNAYQDQHHHEFIGNILDEDPPDGTFRLYFQNLNGLNWDNQGGKWPYVCEIVEGINVDVACFAELNINTNNYEVRRKMENICQRQHSQSRLVMASSKHKTTTIYKPGGTAILACNAITAHIKTHTRDRMGRWTSMCISLSPTKRLRVISAYQVCSNSNPGTNTAASQQRAHIIEELSIQGNPHRYTPREAFIQDLQTFLLQIQQEEEEIVLVGDFNDDISSPTSGMDTLAARCGLIDLFSIRLGSSNFPATYQRGTRRLDYALISPNLLPKIRRAGYDPFGYRIPSDHRGLFIDFSTDELFSQGLTPLAAADRRDFRSTSPGVIGKYVRAKLTYLEEHSFFSRLQHLVESPSPNHQMAESLDRDFQRSSLHAAKVCARKPQPPWSPQLAEAWAELHFYRLARSALTTSKDLLPAIAKLQGKWPMLPKIVPNEVEVIRQCYADAMFKLKNARQTAKELREKYLEEKAAMYSAMEENGKAKAVQRLIRAEMQHQVYRKIRYLRQQDQGTKGLSALKIPRNGSITDSDRMKAIPDTPEYWETVTIPAEIERLLLDRNQHHFGQAEGTPFASPPLQAEVGYKADGLAADLILEGRYDATHTDAATSLLVQHLQTKTTTTLRGQVTKDEVRNKLKRWKESTTTSPSGLHLGHYHCLWRNPHINPEDDALQTIIDGQDCLISALTDLLNYALRFGYAFQRWTKVINVMLEKDEGNPRIHRLRVIHIYEADYNLLLAIKWRQAMHHAEDNKLLNIGLYGSRPGRSALDPALLEVLQHEIYRMSMKSGINFDLDATSCYDRILANVAALSSRRMGVDKNVTIMNATILQQAQYYLKTSLGISESHYQHGQEHPIHGTGQGSGNSPSIWCFVCSALFDSLAAQAHGARFTDYNNIDKMQMFMVGFVDDCAQRVNRFDDPDQPTADALMRIMERDAQLWNDLLWASGGALEQPKCSFHLIQSAWNKDGHPFLVGGTKNRTVYLVHKGLRIPTKQMSNYKSHKSLGCHINPALCRAQPWANLHHKNNKLATLLETNVFTRAEAWVYYTAIYLPSMTYPLPITPLSKSQCERLDSRFFRALLPRNGYNRNMACEIRYGPRSLGGAGFKQLYVEQGALMVQQIFKYLNSPDTQIGQLLRMTISWTQAFLGISELFLTDVHCPIPPVGPSMLLELRTFLREIDGKFLLQTPLTVPLLRLGDRFIMDIALHQVQWKQRHILQINSCRRFVQAQTLADITNLSGTRIQASFLTGEIAPSNTRVRCALFNQPRPEQAAWRTWRRFLQTLSDSKGVLSNPLRSWIVEYQSLRHWPAFVYDPRHDTLYSHVSGPDYRINDKFKKGLFLTTFRDETTSNIRGYPTAIMRVAGMIRPLQNYITMSYQPESSVWEQQLLQQCTNLVPAEIISQHIIRGNIIIGSDGSVTKRGATFGFVASTKEGTRLVRGNGPAPGAFASSFRSEAYGLLAASKWLSYNIPRATHGDIPAIEIYLDNKSVIQRTERMMASKYTQPNHKLQSEHDVIEEIVATVRSLPFKVRLKWIKGHQDDKQPKHRLTLSAQLNCEADSEASHYKAPENYEWDKVPPLPHTPCQLVIQHQSITGKVKRRTHEAATTQKLWIYLQRKFSWSPTTIKLIDWDAFSDIIQKYRSKWQTVVKHIHNISPTGTIAHRNNPHLPHQCPACDTSYETNTHVITCPSRSRSVWRTKTIHKLRQNLQLHSDPYMIDLLHDGLTRFHRDYDKIDPTRYPGRYEPIITTQNEIGWDQLYKGRWSVEWRKAHEQYMNSKDKKNKNLTGHSWVLSFGRLLMDQWFEVWQIRNEERHGKDKQQEAAIRAQRLTLELKDLYTYQDKVCPTDRGIFLATVEEHLNQHSSLDSIENWIETYRDAIKASVNQAATLGIQRNRTLLDYPAFNPIIHPRD